MDKSSEEYRHACEVRYCLALRAQDRNKAMDYLERVEKARGKEAAARLEQDVREQWAGGNRGEFGVWITKEL